MPTYVYIAAPYTKGDVVVNVRNAIAAADELTRFRFIPYVPHLSHFWHFLFPRNIDFWYKFDLAWLDKCDCLVRLEGESVGADNEVKYAIEKGIPVYYGVHECVASVVGKSTR